MGINLDIDEKILLVEAIKKVGPRLLKDIPNTSMMLSKMPKYKYNLLHFITNYNVRNILITLDIVFIVILIIVRNNIKILIDISRIIIVDIIILFICNIYLMIYSGNYTNEFMFINRMLKYYNYSIILYEIIMLFILILIISVNKVINKIKNA